MCITSHNTYVVGGYKKCNTQMIELDHEWINRIVILYLNGGKKNTQSTEKENPFSFFISFKLYVRM